MTKSLAEEELNTFIVNSRKIYKYTQEFIPDHYITVQKILIDKSDGSTEDDYKIVENESTTIIKDFNKEMFIKLLIKEELKSVDKGWFIKINDLRTGGCNCGAWSTSNPNNHVSWCSKGKSWFGAGHE